MLIVGEKEVANRTVSVRRHGAADQGSVGLDEFVVRYAADFALPPV